MSRRGKALATRLLSAALGVAACGGPSVSHDAQPTGVVGGSTKPVVQIPLAQRQIARFTLAGQPDWLGADDNYLYVKEDSGAVNAIDPKTNRVAWRVVTGYGLCQGLGVGFGSVWTCAPDPQDDSDDVLRIDVRSHRVVATLRVGKSDRQGRLVAKFGRVWVITSSANGSALVGIDPATGKTDPPIPLGILAVELTSDDRLVWAISSFTGEVVGVDPATRKLVRHVGGLGELGGPSVITVGDGDLLWVSGDRSTAGIDRATGRVVVHVAQPTKGFGGFVATKSDLWIHSDNPFLTRVDPATGQPIEQLLAPDLPNPGDIIYAFGSLWASSNNQATLVRLKA